EILRVYRIVVEVLFQHLFNNFVRHSPIDFRKNTVDKLVMSELLVSRISEPAKACRQQLLHINSTIHFFPRLVANLVPVEYMPARRKRERVLFKQFFVRVVSVSNWWRAFQPDDMGIMRLEVLP